MNQDRSNDTSAIAVRLIREDELPALLSLYRHLHAGDEPSLDARTLAAWQSIRRNPDLFYLAAELEGQLVASCVLAVIPNLTRSARPFAIVENVVTHAGYRRRGLGTAVLRHAIDLARNRNCYKIMLLTGSKRPETLRFYEQAGFRADLKTGFTMPLN